MMKMIAKNQPKGVRNEDINSLTMLCPHIQAVKICSIAHYDYQNGDGMFVCLCWYFVNFHFVIG